MTVFHLSVKVLSGAQPCGLLHTLSCVVAVEGLQVSEVMAFD